MDIKIIRDEPLLKELSLTIPQDAMEKGVEARLTEMSKKVKMAGFRPGKVPMAVMKQKHGAQAQSDFLDTTLNSELSKFIREKAYKLALAPQYKVDQMKEGEGFKCSVIVELLPEIEAVNMDRLSATQYKVKVPEEKVNETLQQIAKEHAETAEIKTKRGVKKGDFVVLDFEGIVDGKPLENGTAHDYELEIGSGSFIKGFEEALEKMKVGDQKSIDLQFPDPYHAAELAGKDVTFKVTINKIKEAQPVELNDALAEKLGFKDLTLLKEEVSKNMEKEYDRISNQLIKSEILDQLDDQYKFDLPEGMLQQEISSIIEQVGPRDKNGKLKKLSDEELKAMHDEQHPVAVRRVKLGLLLADIASTNKIEVTNKELDDAVLQRARSYPGQERQVFEYFQKNPDAVASLKAPLLENKVIDFLVKNIKLNEKDVTIDALQKLVEAKNTDAEAA